MDYPQSPMNRSLLWPSARVFVRTGRTGAGPEADGLVSLKPAGQLCALISVIGEKDGHSAKWSFVHIDESHVVAAPNSDFLP